MSDCRFGVSPVNYPDPDPDRLQLEQSVKKYLLDILGLGSSSDSGVS